MLDNWKVRSCIYCGSDDYSYDHTDWDTGEVVYRCDECGKLLYTDDFNYSDDEGDDEQC